MKSIALQVLISQRQGSSGSYYSAMDTYMSLLTCFVLCSLLYVGNVFTEGSCKYDFQSNALSSLGFYCT